MRIDAELPRAWLRAALVECARGGLPPDEPDVLRTVAGVGWRVEHHLRRGCAKAYIDRAQQGLGVGPRAAAALAREAHDVDLQRRLEELVLGRVEPFWLGRYATLDGVAPADPPALYLALAMPHPLLGVYALALARPGLCALHPDPQASPAERTPDRWLHTRFASWRRQLPVLWSASLEDAPRALAEGRSVHAVLERPGAAPVDDPAAGLGAGRVLGAPLAELVRRLPPGTPLRLLLVHRERDKRWWIEATPPLDEGAVVARFAAHLRRWPGQALPWLCRSGVDPA